MGSFPSLNESIATSIPGIYVPPPTISGTVAIANGGTGQITAPAALAALGGTGPGSHTVTKGSNGGDYNVTNTSFATLDSAMNQTVVIPTGFIALIFFCLTVKSASGFTFSFGVSVDGTVALPSIEGGNNLTGNNVPCTCIGTFIGDGSSHVIVPAVATGGGTAIINNNSGTNPYLISVLLGAT